MIMRIVLVGIVLGEIANNQFVASIPAVFNIVIEAASALESWFLVPAVGSALKLVDFALPVDCSLSSTELSQGVRHVEFPD
jgi:hypothetical protein